MNPQDNLERKLGLFPVTNIVVANIIGAGIFTTTGYLMDFLGNPIIMLALWLIGGIIALCGALAFGELGAAFPEAGGEYTFISKLFHPLLGFLSGWLSLIVGFSAPIAASAIGFSKYLIWAFPDFQSWFLFDEIMSSEMFSRLLAIFAILLFSLLHARGMAFGAGVQNGLTLLKVVLVAGLVFAGLTIGKGNFQHLQPQSNVDFRFDFAGWKSIGLSLMFIMFAYSGWNSSTYIGSEIKNPSKVIPQSLLISTGVVALLYFLLNLFFVYAVPPEQMAGEPEIGGVAVNLAFGDFAGTIISLLISFALFSSLSAFIILGPRVYYKMARDGLFFKWVSAVHPRFKVPQNALLLQSAIAITMVLSGTFEEIMAYMGFSLGIFPILAVLGVFKLRMSGQAKLKLPGYPIAPLFFIVVNLAILVLAFCERPWESTIAILTALSGIPVFYWFKRKKEKSVNS
ncbi:amino acid/polyamine/organocation transporter, APC superfamily [Mariniphaga anaerophila]|uniref:Amino acid/polyamine/organocation transporter, APC superfamily n=1 Tax=Mariniphaga anaerophila TaxID=1484053 RepID=A0A1M5DM37_9BACT|nr:amino acid permease [Mariniphaga anaerophila]SHF67961.1 amino acid/polyamine/organocation transporter, APC superfamily [Mariniphaga anaerophila]